MERQREKERVIFCIQHNIDSLYITRIYLFLKIILKECIYLFFCLFVFEISNSDQSDVQHCLKPLLLDYPFKPANI